MLSAEASRIHGLEPQVASTIDPDVIRSRYHAEDAQLQDRFQEGFLATVSSELRTRPTSIAGALQLLQAGRGGPLGDGAEELLAVAGRNTRRLRRLVDDLPDANVVLPIDPDRVAQVLANLLSNAVPDAPGSEEVRVTVTGSRGYVQVGVLDRGPGVPEGFAERAFTRFWQADPEDARSRGGTGLGLAICREIVERHGGTVGSDSAPGRRGFHFALPIHS